LHLLNREISLGVELFFKCANEAFSQKNHWMEGKNFNIFHIFLAGNSCKSNLVKEIFEKEIKIFEKNIKTYHKDFEEVKLYAPLGSMEAQEFMKEKNTCTINFVMFPDSY